MQKKFLDAYKEITAGEERFVSQSGLTPISVINDSAFPFLTGPGGNFISGIRGAVVPCAVAGFCGNGRYVAFADEWSFSTEADQANEKEHTPSRLRENILTWLTQDGKKKRLGFTHGHKEQLGLSNFSAPLQDWLKGQGIVFENAEADLSSYDAIIVGNPWEELSASELDALESFVKNGGGLLIASLGWYWAYEKNDPALENLPTNRIGARLGFRFENGSGSYRFNIPPEQKKPAEPKPLEMVQAEGKTDEELAKFFVSADENTVYALEGKYNVIHFTNDLWKTVKRPKRAIDYMDEYYEKEHEFVDNIAHPYFPEKLWYITNVNTPHFMYMSTDHCGMGIAGATHYIKHLAGKDGEWPAFPGWGYGHELGHAMVNIVCGGLFQPDTTGESWCNVIGMYAQKELGYEALARNQGTTYSGNFYGDNKKFAHLNGTDYDLLPDEDRVYDILKATTTVFVKLPMLIVDYYGWDGMKALFVKAATDTKNGFKLETSDQRMDYMIVNLSEIYGVDFTSLFEHWRFPVAQETKDKLKELPPEKILMDIYATTKDFAKYEAHRNSELGNN